MCYDSMFMLELSEVMRQGNILCAHTRQFLTTALVTRQIWGFLADITNLPILS